MTLDETLVAVDATEGLGQALQAAREARQLAVSQVADQLKLSSATVTALEADDWERLPAPVFVRGYIRAYARLMALDGETLLDSRPSADDAEAQDDSPSAATRERSRGLYWWIAGAALAAAIGGTLSILPDQ